MQGASRESLREAQAAVNATVDSADAEALEKVADELFAVVGLLAGQPRLRRALSDPSTAADRRGQVVDALFAAQVSEPTLTVLRDVVGRRWSEPSDLTDAVETLAATAAFAAAEKQDRLDEVEDELFRFGRIVDSEPELRGALTDPGMPVDRKLELLRSLLGDKVADTTLQVLDYVVAHPRGRTFERGVAEFGRLAAARRERLIARVTTAVTLDDEQQQRLAEGLARVYGRQVVLQIEVDPDLLGGVVVRVGDELIDGSVAKRLEDARRRLAG